MPLNAIHGYYPTFPAPVEKPRPAAAAASGEPTSSAADEGEQTDCDRVRIRFTHEELKKIGDLLDHRKKNDELAVLLRRKLSIGPAGGQGQRVEPRDEAEDDAGHDANPEAGPGHHEGNQRVSDADMLFEIEVEDVNSPSGVGVE
ncbi:hypothetical protein JX266_012243 [Neoarthrinium moseri]|uniref:uncharacterized protein n=1 Tax=Neoarthrinium moseri TaxID=1658444 RepID=UPI001FDC4156|nr:uncharacterized protein JN550_003818 [Neoarthrinium moseri]KAI1841590.1 hypothetical protein JX266_012243 [Neoarthrinium moseri]KAI1872944.1 hypothetical protein JN550_003818 [Neoarthrinium moseri]